MDQKTFPDHPRPTEFYRALFKIYREFAKYPEHEILSKQLGEAERTSHANLVAHAKSLIIIAYDTDDRTALNRFQKDEQKFHAALERLNDLFGFTLNDVCFLIGFTFGIDL